MKPIALQTYTLREAFEKDFHGTLKAVAEIGYKGIEAGGTYGQTPEQYVRAVKDLGMTICSNHGGLPTRENLEQVVSYQQTIGSTRLVTGFGRDDLKTVDTCKSLAGRLQTAAGLLAPYGISLHIHNHDCEFHRVEDGRYALDVILDEAPDLRSELDIYWAAFGGADPVEVLRRIGKRVEVAHVKDGLLGGAAHFKPLGAGSVDLPAAIGALLPDVAQWLIVEQDQSDGDMLADVKTSYAYLTSTGLGFGNR